MSGKTRPSLRAKTLENVKRCNLSQSDKNCITEVFKRYEDRWINLEEQKPTQSGSYLITTKNGAVCTAHWYVDSKKFSSPAGKNAEYWMPMPASPDAIIEGVELAIDCGYDLPADHFEKYCELIQRRSNKK